jgi:hypothetical protein
MLTLFMKNTSLHTSLRHVYIMLQVSHLYRPYERRDVVVFHPPEEFMKYSSRVNSDEVNATSAMLLSNCCNS